MEAINPAELFGAKIKVREEECKPLPKRKTEEMHLHNYDEPMYFFKGTVYGLFFCLPFWIFLIWLIT